MTAERETFDANAQIAESMHLVRRALNLGYKAARKTVDLVPEGDRRAPDA